MNMKSIYANPYKYSCVCDIPFELAKIMCKNRAYCPVCKSKKLIFEHGSYEEGYDSFIECDACGKTFDYDKIPNIEYASIAGYEDFDAVLYFGSMQNKSEAWKEACGAITHDKWIEFAAEMIIGNSIVNKPRKKLGTERSKHNGICKIL